MILPMQFFILEKHVTRIFAALTNNKSARMKFQKVSYIINILVDDGPAAVNG